MTTDYCAVCGSDNEATHRSKEELGILNHRWSPTGELVKAEKRPKSSPPSRPQIMVVGAVDVNLRQLLHEKGILTDEDLAALLDPGAGATGDRGTGETEGSD